MRLHLLYALSAGAVVACATPAAAASFNCAKAGTPVEKAVCADPKLSALDSQVGRAFNTASEALRIDLTDKTGDYPVLYRRLQKEWLADRDKCAADKTCLTKQYERRLAVLTLKPDPLKPAGVDKFLGLYHGARQKAADMAIMRDNNPNGVLVSINAVDPDAGRWTCEVKGGGYTNEEGGLDIEVTDDEMAVLGVLHLKFVGKELRVEKGEGVDELLSGSCGAGGGLAEAYVK